MRKREIIKELRKHLESMPREILQNLLDTWDGKTPKLWQPDPQDPPTKQRGEAL
jgi:hypothetical protein